MMFNSSTFQLLIIASFLLLMTGCASMDQSECTMANWSDIGLNDGENGNKSSYYTNYQEDCGKFGINVDTNAYLEGWEAGIAHYCTSDNGYRVGNSGIFYKNSCPAEFESDFFSAYQLGRNIHTHQSRINSLHYQIQKIGDDLANNELNDTQRNSLSQERSRLKRELGTANIGLVFARTEAQQHGF